MMGLHDARPRVSGWMRRTEVGDAASGLPTATVGVENATAHAVQRVTAIMWGTFRRPSEEAREIGIPARACGARRLQYLTDAPLTERYYGCSRVRVRGIR